VSDTVVLCYHALSPRWTADLSVTPGAFETQIRTLLDRGYEATTFSDAVLQPRSRTLAVTFDDAFRSVLELAFPLLRRLGIPATVFVPTHFPGATEPMAWPGIDHWLGGEHEDELRCMTWDELRQLDEAGWEIASHTHTHPDLTRLDDDALARELRESRDLCSDRIGKPCSSLAYPYGAYDERVVAAAGRAGYEAAGTLPARLHKASPLAWPRVGVYHGDTESSFKLKVSPTMRRLRASALWSGIDAVRRGLRRNG
jgi:peptidoglycan/xylan/chitin deacetylase (PgdA/CDA1 family)